MNNELGLINTFSPYKELLSYEYLWSQQGSSLKNFAENLTYQNLLPSQFIKNNILFGEEDQLKADLLKIEAVIKPRLSSFSVMFKENFQFPQRLLKAKHPIDMFYYRGNLDLLESPCLSIVGARKMTPEGQSRAHKLAKRLSEKYTIVSGLAAGIDTEALKTAMEYGGNVIAVIGTPIDRYYPPENKSLQDKIAKGNLLISQVPLYKYDHQPFNSKRCYFPERNITMAALSDATIIVEASDTSGSHTQAKACFDQGKKLFILDSCFKNQSITWPKKYLEKGAYRVGSVEEIFVLMEKP